MADILQNSVRMLAGVGERRALLLEKELGIRTLGDLLYHFPFRYIDRTKVYRIGEITDDPQTFIQLRARVLSREYLGAGPKRRLVAQVSDQSGVAELVWFAGTQWIEKQLEVGREYVVFGRASLFNGRLSMVHPEIESIATLLARPSFSVQGVYSTTEKLATNHLSTKNIYNLICALWNLAGDNIEESLPQAVIAQHNLMPLREALYNAHFPQSAEKLRAAQHRLKFEELLGVELNIMSRRQDRVSGHDGFLFPKVGERFNALYNTLPFPLTGAQKRVIKEIRADTVTGHQMNRLLQGDVGSGKTLVALLSMLLASDNGFQSCMMAPTEILTRQHFATLGHLLENSGVRVACLTGSTRKKERDQILMQLAANEIDILVGTHALLEDRVQFASLGFVVIDEQHRFGVEQRSRLWTKNHQPPHVLVMTATPIPRTLAMTLYGDLEVSILDELPPGRKPIKTVHYRDGDRLRVWGFMRDQIHAGRQVYVVYPLIKESEKMDYKDLYDGYESISRDFPLPRYHTTVVHGKMKPADKQEAMRQFKDGMAHIMVATSVIEVGVDVPNATVMVIESAERFGLSALHQLRGRVGRGSSESFCVLMSGDKLSREARARLKAMVESNDGFYLAELDMKLRGMGDLTGTQQSGLSLELKIADLARDGRIIEAARDAAIALLDAYPALSGPGGKQLRTLMQKYSAPQSVDFSKIS
ncbi:MAG: ATP-dependent DNA helicase RecG [Rikenellaceae bacterium]|jgi:ATP-dependent DNA helicase RecG|nr:ATP-dependent DNA helicase RecG [Rikenellaceae bacterium]